MKKNVNGVVVDCTSEEIAYFQSRQSEEVQFEKKMNYLRMERNNLLKQSDWAVLPDSPITNKTDWQNYRQELRDITEGLTTVEEVEAVEFPTKP